MSAVRLLVRSELRRRWGSLLVVALLVAITGGVTLAAVAGRPAHGDVVRRASRTHTRNHDVLLFAEGIGRADVEQLRALPGVDGGRLPAAARDDPARRRVPRGRRPARRLDVPRRRPAAHRRRAAMPRPGRPEEVVVPEPLARQTPPAGRATRSGAGLHPGADRAVAQRHRADLPPPGGSRRRRCAWSASAGCPIDLSLQGRAGGVLSAALVRREVRPATSATSPARPARCCSCGSPTATPASTGSSASCATCSASGTYDVDPAALTIGGIQDSIDILAVGILVFGAIAGIAGLDRARRSSSAARSRCSPPARPRVRDLGMSRRRRALAVAGPAAGGASASGAVVAVLGAWLASPLMPFGVAGSGRAASRASRSTRCPGARRGR